MNEVIKKLLHDIRGFLLVVERETENTDKDELAERAGELFERVTRELEPPDMN